MIHKNADLLFEHILCIYYSIRFKNDKIVIQILIDFKNKVNIMIIAYISKIDFKFCSIYIEAEKIDGSTFKKFGITLTSFWFNNKLQKP